MIDFNRLVHHGKRRRATITPQMRDLRSNAGEFFFLQSSSPKARYANTLSPSGSATGVQLTPQSGTITHQGNLLWLNDVSPQKMSLPQAELYIRQLIGKSGNQWRLPSFDELNRAKIAGILGRFSKLEIWASRFNEKPAAYNARFGNRNSNLDPNSNRYVLLVRTLK